MEDEASSLYSYADVAGSEASNYYDMYQAIASTDLLDDEEGGNSHPPCLPTSS